MKPQVIIFQKKFNIQLYSFIIIWSNERDGNLTIGEPTGENGSVHNQLERNEASGTRELGEVVMELMIVGVGKQYQNKV